MEKGKESIGSRIFIKYNFEIYYKRKFRLYPVLERIEAHETYFYQKK